MRFTHSDRRITVSLSRSQRFFFALNAKARTDRDYAPLIILSDSITLATGEFNSSSVRLGFAIAALPLVVVDELIGDPRYGDQNTIDRLDRKFL